LHDNINHESAICAQEERNAIFTALMENKRHRSEKHLTRVRTNMIIYRGHETHRPVADIVSKVTQT